MEELDLRIDGKYIYHPTGVLKDQSIAVSDGIIADIGPTEKISRKYDVVKIINARSEVILPGLINTHTHETLPRGFHEDLPLMEWLQKSTLPAERALTPEQMEAAARLNQAEMIRSGITTFVEIFRHQGAAANVAKQSGLRGIFSSQSIDEPYEIETVGDNRKVIEQYHGAAGERIQVWVGIHAPYTCTEETMIQAHELAKESDTRLHTHLAESETEFDQIKDETGQTPVGYLDELGILNERLHAAHCVHLTDKDITRLADSGASVAYNPVSNMKLADGIAPVPELLEADIPVGLATDSNLSNNNLDMFEEMRMGSYAQKYRLDDPSAMSCELMLNLATKNAADSLGLTNIGQIEQGMKADLITVNIDTPHLRPLFSEKQLDNLVANIVYSGKGADVTNTIVDGTLLMHDSELKTLDERSVLEEAQQAAKTLHQDIANDTN